MLIPSGAMSWYPIFTFTTLHPLLFGFVQHFLEVFPNTGHRWGLPGGSAVRGPWHDAGTIHAPAASPSNDALKRLAFASGPLRFCVPVTVCRRSDGVARFSAQQCVFPQSKCTTLQSIHRNPQKPDDVHSRYPQAKENERGQRRGRKRTDRRPAVPRCYCPLQVSACAWETADRSEDRLRVISPNPPKVASEPASARGRRRP